MPRDQKRNIWIIYDGTKTFSEKVLKHARNYDILFSNEVSTMLEGFKIYFVAPGGQTITFTRNGLGFSKAVVAKLDNARYVKLMFDKPGKRMAIQKCNESDEGATIFSRSEKPEGLRWNTRDLSNTIRKIAGWDVEQGQAYKVEGEWLEEEEAFIFDFNTAEQS